MSKPRSTSVHELSLDLRQKGKLKFGGFEDTVFSLRSLSKNTHVNRKHTFAILGHQFKPDFSGRRLCESKDTWQQKFVSIKTYAFAQAPFYSSFNLPQPQDSWGHVSTHTRQYRDRHMSWMQPIQQLCLANKQRHLDQHQKQAAYLYLKKLTAKRACTALRTADSVHTPLFSRNIVQIERFPLWAAILDAMIVKSTQGAGDGLGGL